MARLDEFSVRQSAENDAVSVIRGAQSRCSAYWRLGESGFAREVRDLPGVALRRDALALYMAQMSDGPVEQTIFARTLFEGVRKAPAGHRVTIRADEGDLIVAPLLPASPVEAGLGVEALVGRLKEALLDTARDLVADRQDVWVEASGGIDSTLMGALARRVMPAGSRLHAVSLLYPYYEFRRERQFIDRAVRWLGARHICLDGSTCLSFSDLNTSVALSEPSLVLAGLAQHCAVFNAVDRCGSLLLNGNGGDYLFALCPERKLRFRTEPRRFEWMSEEFHANVLANFNPFRDHYRNHSANNEAAFLGGSEIDDRWIEREIAPTYGVDRTHLFLDPQILPLIRALWQSQDRAPSGKWIISQYFADLVPPEIVSRPGKVAYNGLYCRAYRAASGRLFALIRSHAGHLESVGIRPNLLYAHLDRLSNGELDGDLEVSVVITYLIWLRGWACAGRSLE